MRPVFHAMKRLFAGAEEFIRSSTWRDLALLKFCLFALGFLSGTKVPRRRRLVARLGAALLFVVTYIPLMIKFIAALCRAGERDRA